MSVINLEQISTGRGDERWSDLNVGDENTPVYIQNGIPVACNITTGVQGTQGLQGFQGPAGMVGMQGTQGVQGRIGLTGVQGMQGAKGVQGSVGAIGEKGDAGAIGLQGVQGVQGAHGYQGLQGPSGKTGFQGVQGKRGCNGLQGVRGTDGVQGVQGFAGVIGVQGVQGLRGANGNIGIQGASGMQGMQGYSGYQGIQGSIGVQGIQGSVGSDGYQGLPGFGGVQGIQGCQGPIGNQGVQGIQGGVGIQGIQGNKGFDGPMGYQGKIGLQGMQGYTGGIGIQGVQGKKGIPGVQGKRGCNGLQGVKGTDGVQGVQGFAGRAGYQGIQGPNGVIGWRGSDGFIGIQGAEGEKGSLWVDGIRLNGYNTHMFSYDAESSKFKPKNSEYDVLYVRKGAVIKIYLDQNAYNAISVEDKIKIDSAENNSYVETNYETMFAGGVSFSTVVTLQDVGSVLEFTFDEINGVGRWLYSGGLRGSGGTSVPAVITSDFSVKGVSIGSYSDGSQIVKGETLESVIKKMLTKIIDVHAVNPKLTIGVNGISDKATYEVGTIVYGSYIPSFVDGKFVGDDGYEYSVDAGCSVNSIIGKLRNVEFSGTNFKVTYNSSEDVELKAIASHSASSVVPVKNDGTASEKVISGGSVESNTIVTYGRYKYFYGSVVFVTDAEIGSPTTYDFGEDDLELLSEGFVPTSGSITIDSIQTTELRPSFIVVVPSEYSIVSTKNSLGAYVDVTTTWHGMNTFTKSINGKEYKVHVSQSMFPCEYREIIISK